MLFKIRRFLFIYILKAKKNLHLCRHLVIIALYTNKSPSIKEGDEFFFQNDSHKPIIRFIEQVGQ